MLSKESELTNKLILSTHKKLSHAGCYSVLSELRKKFWIPHYYSVVKKSLRSCTHCRRFNNRVVKINQAPYRDFRINPSSVPYRNVFVDHMGPFYVKLKGEKIKVWLLCITCLWSRAINLKLCLDMTAKTFLRALQLHVFEYGIPNLCLSVMGT